MQTTLATTQMCGIVGVWRSTACIERSALDEALQAFHFRGPDGSGALVDPRIGLAYNRLAIVGGDDGSQPFVSASGAIAAVYNGEIYNHSALAAEHLPDLAPSLGLSDGALLPDLYERLGPAMFAELDGMFAVAILDRRTTELVVARDRFGIKPLYYTGDGSTFAVASNLRGLEPWIDLQLDEMGVALYLALGYVPRGATALSGIRKVLPGQWLRVTEGGMEARTYWSPPSAAGEGAWQGDERRLVPLARKLLDASVRGALMGDHPLGAMLSGGLDSSAVVDVVARSCRDRLERVVTVRLLDCPHDETPYAQQVAQRHGLVHDIVALDPHRLIELLPTAVRALDEPIADPALVPTYLAAEALSDHVRCALTGVGGDEIFAGYHRYSRPPDPGVFARYFTAAERQGLMPGARVDLGEFFVASGHPPPVDTIDDMIRFDVWSYLSDQVLPLTDKVAMFHSLEARVPLLTNEISATFLRVPAQAKLRRGLKTVLKGALSGRFPKSFVERSKQGFGAPLHLWLPAQAEQLEKRYVSTSALVAGGVLDGDALRRVWRQLAAGTASSSADKMWLLITLEAWYRELLAARRG